MIENPMYLADPPEPEPLIEDMSVADLREALKPYGTPHRLTMRRAELAATLRRIRKNEQQFGSAESSL